MRRSMFFRVFRLALPCLWIALSGTAFAESELGLDEYLAQVGRGNLGMRGAAEISAGAFARSVEKDVLLAPTLFANARHASDASEGSNQFYLSEKVNATSYSAGIQQLTSFGLSGRLYYQIDHNDILNPRSPLVSAAPGFTSSFYDSKPVIELNLNLWRNRLGRETRATQTLIESGALVTGYGESFRIKMTKAQAEAIYWRLSLARETVAVQKDSVARAKKIRDWNERRFRLQLADRADLLQAEALLQARALELQAASDEEAAASRAFNTGRGIDSDRVSEKLMEVDAIAMDRITIPARAPMREDVKAAEAAQKAAIANAVIGREKNRPTFDLFGSVALNGRDPRMSQSINQSFKTENPTYAAGVKLTMPLDFGTLSDVREGYGRESDGAVLNFERRLFEQERDWADLSTKFNDAKRRLQLALGMEAVQKEKYDHERDRLTRGRTVTFQVLQFEQDYRNSQLARIRSQAELLTLLANMKTYGDAK